MARSLPLSHAPSCRRPRASVLQRLAALAALYRQRRALAQMEDARLDDIGLSRAEALHEARPADLGRPRPLAALKPRERRANRRKSRRLAS